MTASIPTGDGTVTGGPTPSAIDDEAAPGAGLEPDANDLGHPESAAPDTKPAAGESVAPAGRTILDGPALENPEMRVATDDLRSSEDKSAAARVIADELAATTDPTPGDA